MENSQEKIEQVCNEVMEMMGWNKDKAMCWCALKNPNLGGVSPIDMILMGREDKLKKFMGWAKEENRS